MSNQSFRLFCLTPSDLNHFNTAVAAVRSGEIGIIDAEFSHDPSQVKEKLKSLLNTDHQGRIGIRLAGSQISELASLLRELDNIPHYIILTGVRGKQLKKL